MDWDKSNGQAESDCVPSDNPLHPAKSSAASAEKSIQTKQDDDNRAERQVEDATLFDTLRRLIVSPRRTWRSLKQLLESAGKIPQSSEGAPLAAPGTPSALRKPAAAQPRISIRQIFTVERAQLSAYLLAFISALIGTSALLGAEGISRTPVNTLDVGAPYLLLAFVVWLLAELVGHQRELRNCWIQLDVISRARWIARFVPLSIGLIALQAISSSMTAPPEFSLGFLQVALGRLLGGVIIWYLIELFVWRISVRTVDEASLSTADSSSPNPAAPSDSTNPYSLFRLQVSRNRIVLIVALIFCSFILWLNSGGNQIQPSYISLWILTSLLWGLVFAPADWSPIEWIIHKIDAWRRIKWRDNRWVAVAFFLIMILGISFRFTELHAVPPEMTSDHVEKIQDAYRVYSGDYRIFFPNNGGREPVQMYLLAALSNLPGLDFNFFSLKFLSAIESLLTLPLLLWMGLELVEDKRRSFSVLVALLLTGLVAVSYWHVIIGRQGLRIPFTPLVTAPLLIYLARAMRHNRRGDFVRAGLILGFGLYMYQAVRMLTVVIVVGVTVAVIVRKISWQERLRYLAHLSILVFVALMVFLPMLHYSIEFPNHFWMRTSTRILGDDLAWPPRKKPRRHCAQMSPFS